MFLHYNDRLEICKITQAVYIRLGLEIER